MLVFEEPREIATEMTENENLKDEEKIVVVKLKPQEIIRQKIK